MYIDEGELKKLAKSFETYATDLESYLKTFKGATDAETIHDGFGVLTESEEVTSAYVELSEHMSKALGNLTRHLDGIGSNIRQHAHNTEAADDAMADTFKRNGR
jgi:uncharacterized protein YukE